MGIATDLTTAKKGESLHMYAFTGMYLGIFEISAADKKTVSLVQKNGRTTKFDRETGKQLEAKNPHCASKVTIEKIVKVEKKATKKVAEKKAEPTVPEKTSKTAKKPATKKAKKAVEEESDDEYDEA